MIKFITILLSILFISFASPVFSEEASCETACNKYLTCVLSANKNATNEQKENFKKGCLNGCKKHKKESLKCYKDNPQCVGFFNCLVKNAEILKNN
ncbi:MAG: Cys-rich protein [Leptospiraceae bacterium]|nr:Cys-rich protein [Leptospiraceae bacterium]MCP5496065.1 Cys-rich protein [Leptospiraceae bacterium]